ncbi:hypothetical protein ACJO2E_16180 [Marinobacter sp. M1N3S26]|uniref:hypothetical protein n=1 Tax=unclassified Marinobacter TaxID=83889 RepID=UPI00387AB61A
MRKFPVEGSPSAEKEKAGKVAGKETDEIKENEKKPERHAGKDDSVLSDINDDPKKETR